MARTTYFPPSMIVHGNGFDFDAKTIAQAWRSENRDTAIFVDHGDDPDQVFGPRVVSSLGRDFCEAMVTHIGAFNARDIHAYTLEWSKLYEHDESKLYELCQRKVKDVFSEDHIVAHGEHFLQLVLTKSFITLRKLYWEQQNNKPLNEAELDHRIFRATIDYLRNPAPSNASAVTFQVPNYVHPMPAHSQVQPHQQHCENRDNLRASHGLTPEIAFHLPRHIHLPSPLNPNVQSLSQDTRRVISDPTNRHPSMMSASQRSISNPNVHAPHGPPSGRVGVNPLAAEYAPTSSHNAPYYPPGPSQPYPPSPHISTPHSKLNALNQNGQEILIPFTGPNYPEHHYPGGWYGPPYAQPPPLGHPPQFPQQHQVVHNSPGYPMGYQSPHNMPTPSPGYRQQFPPGPSYAPYPQQHPPAPRVMELYNPDQPSNTFSKHDNNKQKNTKRKGTLRRNSVKSDRSDHRQRDFNTGHQGTIPFPDLPPDFNTMVPEDMKVTPKSIGPNAVATDLYIRNIPHDLDWAKLTAACPILQNPNLKPGDFRTDAAHVTQYTFVHCSSTNEAREILRIADGARITDQLQLDVSVSHKCCTGGYMKDRLDRNSMSNPRRHSYKKHNSSHFQTRLSNDRLGPINGGPLTRTALPADTTALNKPDEQSKENIPMSSLTIEEQEPSFPAMPESIEPQTLPCIEESGVEEIYDIKTSVRLPGQNATLESKADDTDSMNNKTSETIITLPAPAALESGATAEGESQPEEPSLKSEEAVVVTSSLASDQHGSKETEPSFPLVQETATMSSDDSKPTELPIVQSNSDNARGDFVDDTSADKEPTKPTKPKTQQEQKQESINPFALQKKMEKERKELAKKEKKKAQKSKGKEPSASSNTAAGPSATGAIQGEGVAVAGKNTKNRMKLR